MRPRKSSVATSACLIPALYSGGYDEDLSSYVASSDAKKAGATGHEVSAKRKDGSMFPLDLTISSFILDDGVYYSAIVRDITQRKQAEQALLSYTHALERSNKELDDFAYIASHDLKEPLRGIHNHSRFLLEDNDGKLDEESTEAAAPPDLSEPAHGAARERPALFLPPRAAGNGGAERPTSATSCTTSKTRLDALPGGEQRQHHHRHATAERRLRQAARGRAVQQPHH